MAETKEVSKDRAKKRGSDFTSLIGLAVGLVCILGGLVLEGGQVKDIAQVTALIVVAGGTAGAVIVGTPLDVLKGSARRFMGIFKSTESPDKRIDELIEYAARARKNGLVSLEQQASEIEDPFLNKALNLAVDGTDTHELEAMMRLEIEIQEARALAEAKVFESAGGYSPTIGIIGAVMGLIQVMKNLANIDEVGTGIAVAFVATVYGVGLANLFLLPVASKIRDRIQREVQLQEMVLEGVTGIIQGLNPKLIRIKLEAFRDPAPVKKKDAKARGRSGVQEVREPSAAAGD